MGKDKLNKALNEADGTWAKTIKLSTGETDLTAKEKHEFLKIYYEEAPDILLAMLRQYSRKPVNSWILQKQVSTSAVAGGAKEEVALGTIEDLLELDQTADEDKTFNPLFKHGIHMDAFKATTHPLDYLVLDGEKVFEDAFSDSRFFGTGTGWLYPHRTGFRPVCQTSVIVGSPAQSMSQCPLVAHAQYVSPCHVRSRGESCRMHRSPLSDCHSLDRNSGKQSTESGPIFWEAVGSCCRSVRFFLRFSLEMTGDLTDLTKRRILLRETNLFRKHVNGTVRPPLCEGEDLINKRCDGFVLRVKPQQDPGALLNLQTVVIPHATVYASDHARNNKWNLSPGFVFLEARVFPAPDASYEPALHSLYLHQTVSEWIPDEIIKVDPEKLPVLWTSKLHNAVLQRIATFEDFRKEVLDKRAKADPTLIVDEVDPVDPNNVCQFPQGVKTLVSTELHRHDMFEVGRRGGYVHMKILFGGGLF